MTNQKTASLGLLQANGQDSWQPNLGPTNPNEPARATGGPQFGQNPNAGWGDKTRGWLNKYGSSVILPIIAILILASGIYLYTSQKSEVIEPLPETPVSTASQESKAASDQKTASDQAVTEPTEQKLTIDKIIPEGRQAADQIIEKAAKSDGITHLSRRALKDYLGNDSQEVAQKLTKEHKIYIEDFLKDKIGSRPLEVDEEVAFSKDLIKEAIDASLTLSPEQLKTLQQYSVLVVSW